MIQLILGGARSGKSGYAEKLATECDGEVIYVATAQSRDDEMAQRIQRHREQRPQHWQLVEEPVYLADALLRHDREDTCLLVDCLTLWLSNLLFLQEGEAFDVQKQRFIDALGQLKGDVILVSNEVGQGIVPMGEINRRFVDESGWLHQDIAKIAQRVVLMTAGLPQVLKS